VKTKCKKYLFMFFIAFSGMWNGVHAATCPAGTSLVDLATPRNATTASSTGNVTNAANGTGPILALDTNVAGSAEPRLDPVPATLTLGFPDIVPMDAVITISLSRDNDPGAIEIQDSTDNISFSPALPFTGANPNNDIIEHLNYSVASANGAQFVQFTLTGGRFRVDGLEYSQICETPPPPLICPAGSTLTPQVGNAVTATETGNVLNPGNATGALESLGTTATNANSANLRNQGDELVLDLGEVVPTNGVVTISIARQQNAASVIIEDSEDGVTYSGGQIFSAGPNNALQRISYSVTAAAGARFIRFTSQSFDNMRVDGVEYIQICEIPPEPPVCPVGSSLTAEVGNAVAATETGNVLNAGNATAAIEAVGTNAADANSARLTNQNDVLILDLGEVVPTNGVATISIARDQNNALVLIEDSEDGVTYSGGQLFGTGPNDSLQQIDYVITAAAGARFIRFTNQNFDDIWVDGVEYSQVCNVPLNPSCPVGSALTSDLGNAVVATEIGNVFNQGNATGVIEALGANASNVNSAELRNTNDQLILDLGELVPTDGLVTISIAREQTNALVLIEDSEDGVTYSGGQLFGAGPNNALQQIDYVITATAGARFIRFTNQNFLDMWVDGVEYNQVCEVPLIPSCPAGSTLTPQVGNAVTATETGTVLNEAQATGAIEVAGTNAINANSARLQNQNDQLILDLGEVVPTNGLVTISNARVDTNALMFVENSEDGISYSGGVFFGTGPDAELQQRYYVITAAAGARFIRFTNQSFLDMWVDGVEYSQICNTADVADLSITKDDGSLTYTPGGTGSYTIVVTNNGPADVVGATIADDLPDGVTLISAWACTPSSTNSSCNTTPSTTDPISIDVDIVNGDFITVTVPVQFSSDMADF